MSDTQSIEQRLDRLLDARPSRWSTLTQNLLSPLILLVIGWWLNSQIEQTRIELEQSKQLLNEAQHELARVSAVQDMLEKLFGGKPAEAFVTERLMKKILDDELAEEISSVVADYYKGELDSLAQGRNSLSEAEAEKILAITEPAKRFATASSGEIAAAIDHRKAFVIGQSIPIASPTGRQEAIAAAERLKAKGYDASVWASRTEYYGIVAGHLPVDKAIELKKRAVAAGDIQPDAYLHTGDRFIEQVWPKP